MAELTQPAGEIAGVVGPTVTRQTAQVLAGPGAAHRIVTRQTAQVLVGVQQQRVVTRQTAQLLTSAGDVRRVVTRQTAQILALPVQQRVVTRQTAQLLTGAPPAKITPRPYQQPLAAFTPAHWGEGTQVESSWLTDVTSARVTAAEDRRGLRQRPVRVVRALLRAMNPSRAWLTWQAMRRRTTSAQPFPILCDATRTTADRISGSFDLPCDARFRRFARGGRALVWSPGVALPGVVSDLRSIVELEQVFADGLTLSPSTPLQADHPKGSKVFPLLDAEVVLDDQAVFLTDGLTDLPIAVQESYGPWTLPGQPAANVAYHAGVPIFRVRPVWRANVIGFASRQGEAGLVGREIRTTTDAQRPNVGFRFEAMELTRAAAWEIRGFHDLVRGRLTSFLLLHLQRGGLLLYDFAFDPSRGWVGIQTLPHGEFTYLVDHVKWVAIVLHDGRTYVRQVLYVVENAGTVVTWDLVVDVALPVVTEFGLADVRAVVPVERLRMASDTLVESWLTDEICSCSFDMVSVFNEGDVETF